MKHTAMRLFCLLLCAVMVLGTLPATASAATQLGKPTNIVWSPYTPGTISWTVNAPVEAPQTHCRLNLYKDGQRVYTTIVHMDAGTEAIDFRLDQHYEFTTGDYYATIRALARQEGYTDSEPRKSAVWSYTHPGDSYATPGILRWDYPILSWEHEYAPFYEVKIFHSLSGYSLPEECVTVVMMDANELDLGEYFLQYGKGYYSFQVRARSRDISQKDHSDWTSPFGPFYSDGRRLKAPSLDRGNNGGAGCPRLVWNKVNLGEKYRLYRAESPDGPFELVKTTKQSSSFLDTTAEPGKLYYYKVRALMTDPNSGKSAYSAYSNVISEKCSLATPEISVSLNDSGDPAVTWETVEGAEKYYIYRSTHSKYSGFERIKTAVTARSFTDTTVKSGTRCYYKILAVNSAADVKSDYSAVGSVTAK